MKSENLADIYELSPLQQGLLFHTIYAPHSGVYFEQFSWTLQGNLDIAAFERAWQRVIDRHAILRTAFYWQELEKPYQVVYARVPLPWNYEDWQSIPENEQKQKIDAFLQADRQQGFDLTQAPLIRLALFKLAADTYQFVWSSHHLLLDGWSESLVFREVYACYQAFSAGKEVVLERPRPYRDYITWLQQQDLKRAEGFWRKQLQGFTRPTVLKCDRAPNSLPSQGEEYDWQRIELSEAATTSLQNWARQNQLTLNTLIQGAWALLLSRYSGESDILFGSTSSGRPAELKGVESMVGLFINTLPMRVKVSPRAFLIPWLQELQATQIETLEYEYSPLVRVQGWSDLERGLPLFEIGYVLENYLADFALSSEDGGITISNSQSFEKTNEALSLSAIPDAALRLELWYDTRRFDRAIVSQMLGHLQVLLENMTRSGNMRLAELSMLSEPEKQLFLAQWSQNPAPLAPAHLSILDLFASRVRETPGAIALVWQEERLTYAELNRSINLLAASLIKIGVKNGDLIGICLERSLEMAIAPLAVMKAGAAYLPLDPAYPCQRLAFMLSDAQASLLLTQDSLLAKLPETEARTVTLSQLREMNPTSCTGCGKCLEKSQNPLAYLVYTSGSTGNPKGVMVSHRSLVNAYYGWEKAYQLQNTSSHLQMASFAFDVFTGDLIRALCSGKKLVICPRDFLLEPHQLYALAVREGIDCAEFVPAVVRNLVRYLQETEQRLDSMKVLICGSDSWYLQEAATLRDLCGSKTQIINSFGVTEATIDSSYFELPLQLSLSANLTPIGRPLANVELYILDANLQPVPVGVPGELYLGGEGLAWGYHQQPDLTAAKFVPHPYSQRGGDRLYQTGDLALWDRDGNVEFLGRVDNQAKIRGYRLELAEIEGNLTGYPGIKGAVVVTHLDALGENSLVAYIAGGSEGGCGDEKKSDLLATVGYGCTETSSNWYNNHRKSTSQLREYLQQRLPEYAIPSHFVWLEELPLTPNGKLDRKALPSLDLTRLQSPQDTSAPHQPVTEMLSGIWSQVLGVKHIAVEDNFFELGGHSLLATQVISRIRGVFRVDLPLRTLFETPTIAALSQAIKQQIQSQTGSSAPPLVRVGREGELPLSFAQQRMWLADRLVEDKAAYNDPVAVTIKGKLNINALERAINQIIGRHEVLRTGFSSLKGQPVQAIASRATISLPIVDYRNLAKSDRNAAAQDLIERQAREKFDLQLPPLIRPCLIWLDEDEYLLSFILHHIVSDGWSMGVLLSELKELYGAFSRDLPSPLPELEIQYADFAIWQRQWLQGEVLDKQLAYWRDRLAGLPSLRLPFNRDRSNRSRRGATVPFSLDAKLTNGLKQLSRQEGVTLFMTLLAGFQTLLYCYTKQTDFGIGSPIANRDRKEIENIIGFFVNTLVLRADLSLNPSFRELLGRVREVTLGAYSHQDLPFEKLVAELQPQRQTDALPLFNVWFVLQNTPLEKLEMSGITLEPVELHTGTSEFDFALFVDEVDEGLSGCFEYNLDLCDRSTVVNICDRFVSIIQEVLRDKETTLSDLFESFESEIKQSNYLESERLAVANRDRLRSYRRE